MPARDGTGPNGEGPKTGRALGYCAGNDRPGYAEPGVGFTGRRGGGRFRAPVRGRGCGLARTRGFGNGFAWRARDQFNYSAESDPASTEDEIASLKEEIQDLGKKIDKLSRSK